jgi:hypothetical protein
MLFVRHPRTFDREQMSSDDEQRTSCSSTKVGAVLGAMFVASGSRFARGRGAPTRAKRLPRRAGAAFTAVKRRVR